MEAAAQLHLHLRLHPHQVVEALRITASAAALDTREARLARPHIHAKLLMPTTHNAFERGIAQVDGQLRFNVYSREVGAAAFCIYKNFMVPLLPMTYSKSACENRCQHILTIWSFLLTL